MAWELLPVNYTDAVWSGLKKYSEVDNEDGTVSFQDVTTYTNKEKSFFGALQANRMNEALNTIMSMVESGSDLYEAFQTYFDTQKVLFEAKETTEYDSFVDYTDALKLQGDEIVATIQTDYRTEMDTYEDVQEQIFNAWFQAVKDNLSQDAAGNLFDLIEDAKNQTVITIPATGWSSTAPYSYTYTNANISSTDDVSKNLYSPYSIGTTQMKYNRKYIDYITDGDVADGSITFYCGLKKPTVDFQITLKGVSA